MKKFLLDTNVLSESVKTPPNKSVLELLEKHRFEIVTAAPVWHELQYGCHRLPFSRKRKLIEAFLKDVVKRNMEILPYDNRAASWHARERARLTSRGKTPSFTDGQIAAISAVNRLTLVSRNVADFELFSELTVVNWHD